MQSGPPDGHGGALLWEALSGEVNAQMEIHSPQGRATILDRWHFGAPGSKRPGEAAVETEPWAEEQGGHPLCLPDAWASSGSVAADGW